MDQTPQDQFITIVRFNKVIPAMMGKALPEVLGELPEVGRIVSGKDMSECWKLIGEQANVIINARLNKMLEHLDGVVVLDGHFETSHDFQELIIHTTFSTREAADLWKTSWTDSLV